jgi:hypothetical protein
MTEHALEQPSPALPADASSTNGSAPHQVQVVGQHGDPADGGACTQAQLRRFIKSRPYVPLHELRRRFGLNGPDDDVAAIEVDGRRLFVGLPAREAELLGGLLAQGDVGFELLLDPTSPLIVGVYPMRPVQRP